MRTRRRSNKKDSRTNVTTGATVEIKVNETNKYIVRV